MGLLIFFRMHATGNFVELLGKSQNLNPKFTGLHYSKFGSVLRRIFGGKPEAAPDEKNASWLAGREQKNIYPAMEPINIFRVFTNDDTKTSSIDARGENTMFDAKYNSLFDNAWFRIVVNCALFAVWVGVAFGSLAAR